jgi:hypothetical protein
MSRDSFSNDFDLRRKAEQLRKFAELRGFTTEYQKEQKSKPNEISHKKGLRLPIKNMAVQWSFGNCTNKCILLTCA